MEGIIHGEEDEEAAITIHTLHGTLEAGDSGQMEHKLRMSPEYGIQIFLVR